MISTQQDSLDEDILSSLTSQISRVSDDEIGYQKAGLERLISVIDRRLDALPIEQHNRRCISPVRGDIWRVDMTRHSSPDKPRTCLIMATPGDDESLKALITIAPIRGLHGKNANALQVFYGDSKESVIDIQIVTSVDPTWLKERVARVSDATMREVEQILLKWLGLRDISSQQVEVKKKPLNLFD